MEEIATNKTFICQLTSFLKIGIFSNKGTENENLLSKSIRLYNKYKLIESEKNITKENDEFIRKTLKTLNLILKVHNGTTVDIKNKENQLKIFDFNCHPSIENGNMSDMVKYLSNNPIDILTGLSLSFFLTEGTYRELLWQYVRSIFYISQMVISVNGMNDNPKKKKIFDDCSKYFEESLINITDLETSLNIDALMAADSFLKNKLVAASSGNIGNAKQEVIDMFSKKGIPQNTALMGMIDKISGELEKIDFSQGNIMQSLFGIAQSVATDMRGDIERDPSGLQNAFGAITEVFQDTMMKEGEDVPPELKAMMGNLLNMQHTEEQREEMYGTLMASDHVPAELKEQMNNLHNPN